MITVNGIVIKERFVGENDKFIDILTEKNGIIEASVKGAKKITSKNAAGTGIFTYSKLCLSEGKNTQKKSKYIVNSAEIIESFYNLRLDLKKLSLAVYFADILKYSVVENEPCDEVLRLFLNSLYFLSEKNLEVSLIKSIFEFRLLCEIGLMPHIIACDECAKYEADFVYFFIRQGWFLCEDCYQKLEKFSHQNEDVEKCSLSVLKALRHIAFQDLSKLFSFTINKKNQIILNKITENYLLYHLNINRKIKTLNYYKEL